MGNPLHSLSSDLNLGPGCVKQTEGCPNGAAKISCSCRGNFTIDIPAQGQPNVACGEGRAVKQMLSLLSLTDGSPTAVQSRRNLGG